MKFQDKEDTTGLTVKPMKVNGREIKCMDMVSWFGRMAKDMREILSMIRGKGMATLLGLMEDSIWENGRLENSMGKELISVKIT
jgi:hypothetical protein